MEQPTLHRLEGISPRAFQHPADRAATQALAQIPGVDQVVRKLSELQYERALRQMLLANAVKIGPQQLPELWTVLAALPARSSCGERIAGNRSLPRGVAR